MKEFKVAPATATTKLLILGMLCWMIFVFSVPPKHPPTPIIFIFLSFGAVQFLIQRVVSYRVTTDTISIHRHLWDVSLPRKDLLSATWDPTAFDDTTWPYSNHRNCSYVGRCSSRRLGSFRAYVSDRKNSVVLRFSDKTIVVSPQTPEAFIAVLNVPSDSTPRLLSTSSAGSYFSGYW